MAAEDETRIQERLEWDHSRDSIVGSCGENCMNKCKTIAQCRKTVLVQ